MDKMLIVSNDASISEIFHVGHEIDSDRFVCAGDPFRSGIELVFISFASALADEISLAKSAEPYAIVFADMDSYEGATSNDFIRLWEIDPHLQIIFCTDRHCEWRLTDIGVSRNGQWLLTQRTIDRLFILQTVYCAYRNWKHQQEHASAQVEILKTEKTSQDQADYLANVSHELRTPVHSIGGFLLFAIEAFGINESEVASISDESMDLHFHSWIENLRQERDPFVALSARLRKVPRWLIKSYRNNATHLGLLNELLEPAKLENEQAALKFQREDLRTITMEVVSGLEGTLICKGVSVRYDIIGTKFDCLLDKAKIAQVIRNLVSNAIKFSPENAEIVVRLTERPLELSIIDNGPGIDEKDLGRIFDRYYQSLRTRGSAGSGLGLTISHAHVMQHGGKLWAESDGKNGSTFFLRLPEGK